MKKGNLEIENINFYVFCISIQWCKHCTKLELISDFYHPFLSIWSMKTKYLLYFQKFFPKNLIDCICV